MRVFIPRDTGFLSFLNWLMGSICLTKEPLYPFMNMELQKTINKKLDHFCYNDKTVVNSWFLYFEPIVYDFKTSQKIDRSHETLHIKDVLTCIQNKQVTQGWDGAKEFLFFHIADILRNHDRKQVFQQWRNRTHKVFSRYIRPKPYITNKVNQIVTELCLEANVPTMESFIAVHHRNPSHVKEQGKIHFQEYFDKIDDILNRQPDLHIYLATDTEFAVAVFKQKYEGRLHYLRDVYRTSADDLIDWIFARDSEPTDKEGFVGGKGYDSHAKVAETMEPERCRKMGIDVLLDIFLISKCKFFVHTISNFTITLSYLNPTIELVAVKEIDQIAYLKQMKKEVLEMQRSNLATVPFDKPGNEWTCIKVRDNPDDFEKTDRMFFNKTYT